MKPPVRLPVKGTFAIRRSVYSDCLSDEKTIPEIRLSETGAGLVADLRGMIRETREGVARAVNAGITLLYWRIGKRIRSEVLGNERAEYGKEIVTTLSRQLKKEFGEGFSEKNLRRMIQFAEVFPDEKIVVSLIRQLSWTHILALLPLKNPLQREFYAEMCRVERWSVRTLRERIQSMLYERTAISKKPDEVARAELAKLRSDGQISPDLVFRDPYVLDFLGLRDRYLEKNIEDAILAGTGRLSPRTRRQLRFPRPPKADFPGLR